MTRTHKGIKTRDEIIRSASRLFAQRGYHNTGTADLLLAASISKGAFYHHFPSKEQLAHDVLEHLRRDYQDRLVKPVWVDATPGSRFRLAANIIIELNTSGEWTHCVMLARLAVELALDHDPLADRIRQTVTWLTKFWTDVIADDQARVAINPKLNPAKLADTLIASLIGALPARELLDKHNHLETIFDQFYTLITTNPNYDKK